LRGVIHAAGVLDDGLIEQQSAERFRKVMAPKVRGAWNLHERTAAMQLDFFVFFSSAASLLGSAGQSNYAAANAYLDALARYRRGLGLPALSINWGAWESGGMAADSVRQRMASRGVGAIEPEQGLSLLAQLIGGTANVPAAQIGVVPVDWPAFLSQTPPVFLSRFESFAPAQARTRETFRKRLDDAPPSERPVRLRQFLHDALAGVLGFRSEARIAPQQRFFELGMDSLMSLELRNRLEAELGVKFPSTLAFDYPSLESLGDHVEELMLGKRGAGAGEIQLDGLSEDQLAGLLAAELSGDGHAG
jgi:acyl carrier protein